MSANIHGKMVYSFERPMWHAITDPSNVPMSAKGILKERFGGGFGIEVRPMMGVLNGVMGEIDGHNLIVRTASPYDQKEIVFGTCTDRYLPLQPVDVCERFDESVKEPVETMAFLGDGDSMFISWKMPEFDVRVGDSVELYGIIRGGFDAMHGYNLFTTAVRPVCQNTISLAQGWANANTDGHLKGNIWKGKGVNHNLLRDLGYWMSHVQNMAMEEANLLQNFFGKLAKNPIKSDEEAMGILETAYPTSYDNSAYFPPELRQGKQEKVDAFNVSQMGLRNGIFELWAGAGTDITPDYWGLLNSTTEYFCHVQASKKPIAESVMFGGRQKLTMQMVNTLNEMAQ